MSGSDLAAVRSVYDAFARGEFGAVVDIYDPDLVFVHRTESTEETVWGRDLSGVYHGLAGLRDYMGKLLDVWSEVTIEADDLREVGDSVIATIRMHVVGRAGGLAGEIRFFHVWTFRGGKAIRLDVMPEREQALEVLGLEA